jgi:hypothetical protein
MMRDSCAFDVCRADIGSLGSLSSAELAEGCGDWRTVHSNTSGVSEELRSHHALPNGSRLSCGALKKNDSFP